MLIDISRQKQCTLIDCRLVCDHAFDRACDQFILVPSFVFIFCYILLSSDNDYSLASKTHRIHERMS